MQLNKNSISQKHKKIQVNHSFSVPVSPTKTKVLDMKRKPQISKNNLHTSYVLQILKDDLNDCTMKVKISPCTPMRTVKEILHQKLGLEKNSVYFCSEDQDYNFDYRMQENVGILDSDKRIVYYLKEKLKPKDNLNKSNDQNIRISDFFIYDCLSVGGFSKVFLIRSKSEGKFYAAKFVAKRKEDAQKFAELIENQKQINELLNHQMLVKMHNFIETQFFYIFILDYCPSGQLFCLMKQHRNMTQVEARFYFIETILGVDYMHKQNIIYRDIKPQNILLDKNGHIKIADFGLAKVMRERSSSYCGSIQYMAPEIVRGDQYWFGVDHYCLGSLLYEMMIGCPPFYNPEFIPSQTKYHIVNSPVHFPDQKRLSGNFKDLVSRLLEKDPNYRLGNSGGIRQILSHPWIGKFDRQLFEKKQIEPPFKRSMNQSNFDRSYLPEKAIKETLGLIELEMQTSKFGASMSKNKTKKQRQQSRKRFKSAECISSKNQSFQILKKANQQRSPYQQPLTRSPKKRIHRKYSSFEKGYNKAYSKSYNTFSILKVFEENKINKNKSSSKCYVGQYVYPSNIEKSLILGNDKKNKKSFDSKQDLHKLLNGKLCKKVNHQKQNNMKQKFMRKRKELKEMIEAQQAKVSYVSQKQHMQNMKGINSKLNKEMSRVYV